MPAFRDITDPEASDIAAWIVSLQRPAAGGRESHDRFLRWCGSRLCALTSVAAIVLVMRQHGVSP